MLGITRGRYGIEKYNYFSLEVHQKSFLDLTAVFFFRMNGYVPGKDGWEKNSGEGGASLAKGLINKKT